MDKVSGVGLIIKLILKILKFIGAYWLVICMSPVWIFEWVASSGDKPSFMGIQRNRLGNILAPDWLYDITWYLTLIFMALTIIQNIYRIVKKDPKFNIFKGLYHLVFKKNDKVGFKAKLNKDKFNELSGFVFGKLKGHFVTKKEDEDGHILVIGGAGSGKTSCVAIPTLYSWKERVFAIDIKGELYEKTSKIRGVNNIKVFNPTDPNAYGYDPYYVLKHTDDISADARALALSICPLSAEVKDPFWIKSAQNMLTGLIIYFFNLEMNFSETMELIKSKPIVELIANVMDSDDMKAKMELSQFSGADEKTISGIFTELSNHITVFATNNDLVKALNGEGKTITPQDLENGYDIYCCIPEHKLDQWKDLFSMMVNQFLKSFEKRKEGNQQPILFMIDEFARLGKIDSITNGLATLRGKKVQIALFVQSKSQLNAIYGKDTAEVIADNCNYKAILKASEPNTQEWCSKLVGTYDKLKLSSNVNADMIGFGKGTGQSKTTEEKRIIKPEEFAFMQDIVCIFPTGYYRIEKAPYYQDRQLLEFSKGE